MKRAILAVIIFLLLGAATSIAIAWAAMLIEVDQAAEQYAAYDEDQDGWVALVERSPGRTAISGTKAVAPGMASRTLQNFGWPDPGPAPSWSMLNRNEASSFVRIHEAASGWPMLCLKYTRVAENLRWVEEWDLKNRGALAGLAPWHADSMDPAEARCLPLLPMFPGMVVDTFLYALVWLSACAIVYAYTRWRAATRRRAHLCARCGYELEPSSSDRCPECGAEASYRPPFIGPGRLAGAAIVLLLLVLALGALALVFHSRRPYPPLQHAAYRGDAEAVERLLVQGADIEERMGHTLYSATWGTAGRPVTGDLKSTSVRPLMFAAGAGDLPTVRCLLDAGAFIDAMDDVGGPPCTTHAARRIMR